MNIVINKLKCHKTELFFKEYGSVFHSYEYLIHVGDDYICFTIEEDEIVLAALPLIKTMKNRLKSYHIPPHIHLFGPVINSNYQDKSYDLIKILLQSLPNADHYDFKIYNNGDVLPFIHNGFTTFSVQTHFLPLKKTLDVLDLVKKDKKRDIINLEKLLNKGEIKIIENDIQLHSHFLVLWKKTSERAKFDSNLNTLNKLLNSNVPFYSNLIFDKEGRPIAGTYCPKDNKNMYHILSMGIRSEQKLLSRANILSIYYALKYASENHLNFDFEGSSLPGVAQFYRMMGGEPMTMVRAQRSASIYYQLLRFGKTLKLEFKGSKKFIFKNMG
jgi:hypothetical protein